MKTLSNNVQLIGNVGEAPKSHRFENGKRVARFFLATNDHYFKDGEKISQTQWHHLVAWDKQAELAEKYLTKGKEIAIAGKLTTLTYEKESGVTQYITEIIVHEILFLGSNSGND